MEQICEITQVGPRHWQPFDVASPLGTPFSGFVCRHESGRFGTLAVTEVAGVPRLELIPGMPKIHYPYARERNGEPRLVIPLTTGVVDARFNRKLDGTAIVFYGLAPTPGEVPEVIPRTRLQPVLTASRYGDWNGLLAEALPDRSGVERAVRDQKAVIVFELWGSRNPHLIRYDDGLRLTLHTAIRHSTPMSYRLLADLAGRYGLDLVESLEVATADEDGLAEAYRRWQRELEERNQAAGEGVFVDEGAILMLSTAETATYWKCKPPSIEEIHWAEGRHLGREDCLHALLKMTEEGYDFSAGSAADLSRMLESDFDVEEVAFNAALIEKAFLEHRIEMERRAWLRGLIEQSGIDPTDTAALMRHLSAHYPKKEMGWVYTNARLLFPG